MQFTRQAWGVVALAAAVAVLAWILQRPLLLVGTVAIFAWLLARQWWFVRAVDRTLSTLSVRQVPERDRLTADGDATVALDADLSEATPLRVGIEGVPPAGAIGATAENLQASVDPGDTAATTTFSLRFPVAGRHSFGRPRLTVADPSGLFRTTTRGDPGPTVTVEPRIPRQVHVGEGGEQLGAFGAHRTGKLGEGIETAELREYVAGDPADRIDWKATARLNTPHVREYEVETDLRTVLVVDCRASLAEGPAGRTKLAYLKQVALAYLAGVRRDGEAIGLYAVGDEGVLERIAPGTGEDHYARIRRRLVALEATAGGTASPGGRSPAAARQAASALAGDDSAFGATLRPYFARSETYVQRVSEDPLYRTIATELSAGQGPLVTAVLSDDTRPAELREAVKAARRGDDHVVAFLAPSVLYEADGMDDLDRAYTRYSEFERFRRQLAGQPRVGAYEVAAEDRIDAVLSVGRRRARQ